MIIATFFGLLAGSVGELFTRAFLIDSLVGIPRFGEIDLVGGTQPSVIIREPKSVVVEEDKQTIEIIRSGPASMVGIYQAPAPSAKADAIERRSAIGQGLILTSDGWSVFPALKTEVADQLFSDAKASSTRAKYFLAGTDGKPLALVAVMKDPVTAALFVRAEVKDWPVRRIAGPEEVEVGQRLVVADWLGRGIGLRITDDGRGAGPVMSDRLAGAYEASPSPGREFSGAYAFTLGGEAAAYVDLDGRVVPIGWYQSSIDSLSRYQSIRHPSLGVYAVDLNDLVAPNGQSWPVKQGVILTGTKDQAAVLKGSAAEKSGLKAGDIIATMNNIDIGAGVGLNEIVSRFLPGDEVVLRYWRDGSSREVRIVLSEYRPK